MRAAEDMTRRYLLHDTGLPLGEGNVATRFILNKLDFDLPALATGLVFIIIVVVARRAHARAFGAAVVSGSGGGGAVAGLLQLVLGGRGILLGGDGRHVSHDGATKREETRRGRARRVNGELFLEIEDAVPKEE